MNPILAIRRLSHSYGSKTYGHKNVLHKIDLAIESGTFYAILGRNGAGKTTLLKILAGLLVAKRGSAHILGNDCSRLSTTDWQQIGYVSENQPIYDWLTGNELIAFTSPLYTNWDMEFCNQLQQRLHLPLERKICTYSKGERMKLALLLAMAFHPQILLLDEPFSGLDVLAKEELIACLLEVTQQARWSVVLASHDLMEVERLADIVGLIDGGTLKISEPLDSLLNRFRRIQVFGHPMLEPDASLRQIATTDNGFSFIETAFDAERETLLRQRYGPQIDISPMPLRDILLFLFSTLPVQQQTAL